MQQHAIGTINENQAMEYVDKVAQILTNKPTDIPKLNKKKREKIALILTGLYVLSNSNYRKSLKISDETYQKITSKLISNGAAVHHTITAGKHLPSMLQIIEKGLERFDRMPKVEQQSFIQSLEKTYNALK